MVLSPLDIRGLKVSLVLSSLSVQWLCSSVRVCWILDLRLPVSNPVISNFTHLHVLNCSQLINRFWISLLMGVCLAVLAVANFLNWPFVPDQPEVMSSPRLGSQSDSWY